MDCMFISLLNIWDGTWELKEDTKIKNVIYIYIFTEKVQDITPNTFKNSLFNIWFQQLRDKQSTVIINNTHHNVHLLNQVKGGIPRRGRIYPKTLNKDDFCYQCS